MTQSEDEGLAALLQSPRLRQRRFDTIPLRGPGAASTDVQGRQPGDSTTPTELSDLISSIGTVGVLQPVLAEEIQQNDSAPPRLLLVTGERRLRACRWGASHLPDNPHFASLPAIVCPGPLSTEERRTWQIVENLAREPLRPGEQAAALLLHRCAILTGKLLRSGKPIPPDAAAIEDPVERWEALERIRAGDPACAAPWPEVLRRLGLQLSERKARQLVSAFRALPRHVSEEMDEAQVRLHTRIRMGRLMAGRAEAAEGIWAAVAARGQTRLLPAAVQAAIDDPDSSADEALQHAEQQRDEADAARAEALSKDDSGLAPEVADALHSPQPEPPTDEKERGSEEASDDHGDDAPHSPAARESDEDDPPQAERQEDSAAARCLAGLRHLVSDLRVGRRPDRYTAGSLRLLIDEIRPLLDTEGTE
ncbi:ParB N-terminal domain-containing protein [Streptomonospora salina]|uniref:ParB family chromosome partitioning protein n=1 Tax=Streptomonospora salina TaxID=104205 RepID=A0A841EEC3_9ACTN|nr:ParB N-terminal domain-containing protein [Streptomonospora salina]MBB5998780.1 ParB family chromosome partitioning protein [Streptomonospora salina]